METKNRRLTTSEIKQNDRFPVERNLAAIIIMKLYEIKCIRNYTKRFQSDIRLRKKRHFSSFQISETLCWLKHVFTL